MCGAVAWRFLQGEEDMTFGFGIFVFLKNTSEAVVDFSAIRGTEFQNGLKGGDGVEIFTLQLE